MKNRTFSLVVVWWIAAILFANTFGAAPASHAADQTQAPGAQYSVFLPLVQVSAGPTPVQPAVSDQQVIAAALQDGTIDYGTSLLYRAYALFADPRLPQAFQGAGSEGEDRELFEAMADPALPLETQAALKPFLVRPSHPESVHSQPRSSFAVTGSMRAAGASDILCAEYGWASLRSAKPGVAATVHARCGLPGVEADMRTTLAMIESLWEPMTTLMREPVGDVGGQPGSPDDTIDFFLLEPLGGVWRDGYTTAISKGALHSTIAAPPQIAQHSSAFVLLARSDIATPTFKSSVAHEFFHVLQSAHNETILNNNGKTWWFTEASAVWAESYFVRETSHEGVHRYFPTMFLPSRLPLHQSFGRAPHENRLLMYASYIWPFFMEQERGAAAIGRVWAKLADIVDGDWEAGLQVIDRELPFEANFHRFALRNLNSAFYPDNPLGTRYVDLDPGFYDEYMPRPEVVEQLEGLEDSAPSRAFPVEIPALKAHYYHFSMAESVQQVRFDFGAIAPIGERTISAVLKIKGRPWEVRENLPNSVTFCDEQEPLEDIWIVVSNHSTTIGPTVSGPLLARPLKTPCGCSAEQIEQIAAVEEWSGTISFTYNIAGSNQQYDIQQQRTATVHANLNLRTSDGTAFLGSPTGQGSINDTTYIKSAQRVDLASAFTGSSAPVPYDAENNNNSRMGLAFRSEDCTYYWTTTIDINATYSDGDTSEPVQVTIGSLGSGWIPVSGSVLTGSGAFPGHSASFILNHEGAFYDQPDETLINILGEGNLGMANVTWRFEPVSLPEP